jgi:hypothetical protein
MAEQSQFTENSQSVQAHLQITQSIIQRMSSNSAQCKAWCITLVSAILVIVADKGKPQYALIAFIPALLFFVLDAYYLSLEKMFRQSYNAFIETVHNGTLSASDLYAVSPRGDFFDSFLSAIFSFSIWPFYTTLVGMIYLAKRLVL